MYKHVPLVFLSLLISMITSTSCGVGPKIGCDLTITNEFIESTCGLHNGVRFEEFSVDTFYQDKTPKIFRVVNSFYGHLKDSIYNTQINRIYFNRPTGLYLWGTDTLSNGIYRKWGPHKERVDKQILHGTDSRSEVIVISDYDSIQKLDNETKIKVKEQEAKLLKKCPVDFKPDTWYYVNFFDQRYEAYLYVDNKMNFKLEKISLR